MGSLATAFTFLALVLAVGFYFGMFSLPIMGATTSSYNTITQNPSIYTSPAHTTSMLDLTMLVQASPWIALFIGIVWALIEFRKGRDNEV